jgi:hypothetical protein
MPTTVSERPSGSVTIRPSGEPPGQAPAAMESLTMATGRDGLLFSISPRIVG